MSADVEVNPFRPGGELSKEAEEILKNSTILRDTVIINDPSLRRPNGTAVNASITDHGGSSIKPTQSGDKHTSPKSKSARNGPTALEKTALNQAEPITCEVTASRVPVVGGAAQYQEPKVEHVNIKPGRRPAKCCALV